MTKEEALEKISEYSNAFKNMFSYHNDKEVALAAVKRNGLVLDCCSKELKDDFDIVLAAVSNNGVSIKYASDNLKDNKKIVDAALKNKSDAINYLSNHMKTQKLEEERLRLENEQKLEIINDSKEFIEKYNMTQTDALMVMQILELKIQNKKLGDLGGYIDNINERLDELESNLVYKEDDLNDINSRLEDIESKMDDLKE
ncbi:DUF4116 domain-containing protein [Aliarcobacter butzleri]|jgi:chromosome segregation ATPase|uniref:DUF4116 domain-containing protein n=4 Tax=Arcobacteraceae TaxID=2808963 RepID=A0AA96RBJ2_9BACT|nr:MULTISPECIES: DUF4116 domain-containing protein [Arcobacteraceae]WNL27757.1 DUF4116 domain-containing protein [Arcobacter sp. AZ-2023]WPD05088.1 DUF4116 domain-containing protein [Arcobacter sp. DSM 115956]WPD07182.1 DUF4116 domain-containing protein [Arcobacter sp. DSM 115955]KLE03984.1 hypothetical protein AF78_09860 [Aliarcobacter butzleri L353]MCG3709200.1 DUF4116 domain-containing protein [Aliarcobacter butzleri]